MPYTAWKVNVQQKNYFKFTATLARGKQNRKVTFINYTFF